MTKFNLPIAKPEINDDDHACMLDAINSGWISSLGKYIGKAEDLLSELSGKKYCVTTSNGTTALQLALAALTIKPGSKVILPSCTFAAVANAVITSGCIPITVDVDVADWQIDVNQVYELVKNGDISAVIAVHTYGVPCDIVNLRSICNEFGVALIEDCAEAHNAKVNKELVGSFGDVSCFSFFANKQIVSGEGGALCTDNLALAERARILKSHGMDPNIKYNHLYPGYNYRMTNVSAALLYSQLKRRENIFERRRAIFEKYIHSLNKEYVVQQVKSNASRVNWLFAALAPSCAIRDSVMNKLAEYGIESRTMFKPISKFGFTGVVSPFSDVRSDHIHNHGFVLPVYNELSLNQVSAIVELVNEEIK